MNVAIWWPVHASSNAISKPIYPKTRNRMHAINAHVDSAGRARCKSIWSPISRLMNVNCMFAISVAKCKYLLVETLVANGVDCILLLCMIGTIRPVAFQHTKRWSTARKPQRSRMCVMYVPKYLQRAQVCMNICQQYISHVRKIRCNAMNAANGENIIRKRDVNNEWV